MAVHHRPQYSRNSCSGVIPRRAVLASALAKSQPILGVSRRQALHGCRHRRAPRGPSGTVRCQVQAPERATHDHGDVYSADQSATPFAGIPQIWTELADEHGDQLALVDPHQNPATKLTFLELESQIIQFAAGLQSLGLGKGDKVALFSENGLRWQAANKAIMVALFSENSSRWLVADQAVMMAGAADAVRGAASPAPEMGYIVRHSDACAIVCQDSATLERLAPVLATTSGAASNGSGPALGNGRPVAAANGSSNGAASDEASGSGRPVQFAVVLWGEPSDKCRSLLDCQVLSFADVLSKGHSISGSFEPPPLSPSQLATIVYTSGTTGNPKGVMLSHANLRYQVDNMGRYIDLKAGDKSLSLLPPWHMYERACSYYMLRCACCQVYTNIKKLKEDLAKHPPHHFVCVPLVLDTLYGRVQTQLQKGSAAKRALARLFFAVGTAYIRARRVLDGVALRYAHTPPSWARVIAATLAAAVLYPLYRLGHALVFGKVRAALGIMRTVISGGGSLAPHLDDFFEVLGLPVINGWGLTETSPVLSCRPVWPRENVRGTVGLPMAGTQVRVVDPETRQPLPEGAKGLLLTKGPGVMSGYYKDEAATAKAFTTDGWFDTGDLGWRAPTGVPGSHMAGHIVLTGRAKDTIVLASGENVEPAPIEDALALSPFIAGVVLVGQDARMLGALVVPSPEAFQELEAVRGPMSEAEVREVLRAEIGKLTASRPGSERVGGFAIIKQPFSVEDGTLTRTYKARKPAIFAKYAREVEEVLSGLR